MRRGPLLPLYIYIPGIGVEEGEDLVEVVLEVDEEGDLVEDPNYSSEDILEPNKVGQVVNKT